MLVKLDVNGFVHETTIEPDEYLSAVLRRLGFLSIRRGCDTGVCGACTIHMDGHAVLSCLTLATRAQNKKIVTIEGVHEQAKKIGSLLVAEGADQCGYCSTGLIMSILYLESQVEDPTEDEIKYYLSGNLCRCTGYEGQLRAVKHYFEVKRNENNR